VNLVLAFTHILLTTVLVSVVNQALTLALFTVSVMLLLASSLAGAVAAGTTASVCNSSNIGDGVFNWGSNGRETR
jgi:hypothetical protein